MLMTVEEFRKYVESEESDEMITARLQALELMIRRYTNNNFQNRGVRCTADIAGDFLFTEGLQPFEVGDTVQISQSEQNDGLYTVTEATDSTFTVSGRLRAEDDVLVTLIEYPIDVKMGAISIIKWKMRNEAANNGDKDSKDIQSETISRHSVTYAQDSTESVISTDFGVPSKLTGFLKLYKKARF